jgi:hypothetical protein
MHSFFSSLFDADVLNDIIFRDGVSEGQFSQVLLYEMDAIRKVCFLCLSHFWRFHFVHFMPI